MSAPRPPRLSAKLLAFVLPSSLRGEAVLGDLQEEFHSRVQREGAFRARWWYRRQAWRVIGVYALPGERPTDPMEILSPSEAARRSNLAEAVAQDLRHAGRALARSPGVTGLIVLALALGIGANTAIFSVIDAVLLEPLSFRHPDRVVQVMDRFEKIPDRQEVQLSFPNFRDYEKASSFSHLAAIRPASLYLHRGDERPALQGAHFSSDLLPMMGIRPILGRGFLPEEDQLDPRPVAVLGYEFWQQEMDGSPDVLGRTVTVTRFVQGQGWLPMELEVVGVLPAGFRLPPLQIVDEYRVWADARIFMPLGLWNWGRGNRGMYSLRAVGELAPGVTVERAREELEAIARGIAESDPATADYSVHLSFLQEIRAAHYGPALWVLWAASGLILLVVCANVASLLLGRALVRERELALRTTLGASRGRLFRQLLGEGALLGAAGAGAGLLLAHGGIGLLKGLTPGNVHGLAEAGLSLPVLVFTACAAGITVLLFGLGPAVRGTRADPAECLRAGGRGAPTGSLRAMRWLVAGQVSVSLAILVGAGLLIRSLDRLLAVDPGFEPETVVQVTTTMPPRPLSKYQDDRAMLGLFRRVRDRLEGLPGVVRVAGGKARQGPLSARSAGSDVTMADRPAPAPEDRTSVEWIGISPGYFEALGTPVIRGRGLVEREHASGSGQAEEWNDPRKPRPVLVNKRMAEHFWPGEDPLGKRFYYGIQDPDVVEATLGKVDWSEEWDQRYPTPVPMEVVGVVADVKLAGLGDAAPMAYYSANSYVLNRLYVRVMGDPVSLLPTLRSAVESVDPELEVWSVQPMTQVVRSATADTRFRATLLGLFAGLAVLMTGLGLFGVLGYAVSRRTHEMAVRMSLGARKEQVSRMVVLDGLKLVLPGILVGVLVAVGALRLTSSLLYGVEPSDPLTLAASSGLILLVGLAACWLPAHRATGVEPMQVLREE